MQTATVTPAVSPIRQALVSVSNKKGLVPFAAALDALGVSILSTGGTAKAIAAAGLPVEDVSSYTGFPEMMDGRVKTLHPLVFGGILGRFGIDDQVMDDHGIRRIGLVVANLYPFTETVRRPGCSIEEAIENIDIGGPSMLRAAAKNHANVAVVVDPADYTVILEQMSNNDCMVSAKTRFRLAKKVFTHTAAYDTAIAAYLDGVGITHGLRHGFSLCNFSRYGFAGSDFANRPPKDWPEGHLWARADEVDKITCPDCKAEAAALASLQKKVAD